MIPTRFIALACGLVAISGHAGPGDLDRTFAPGVVMTPLGETSPVTAMGVLSDGRAIIMGRGTSSGGFYTNEVRRYLADGRPDYTLGEQGTDLANVINFEISDFLTQAENKLLIAMKGPGGLLTRQNPDGSLDTSFALGGLLFLGDEELDWENPSSPLLLRQAVDGKILLMSFSAYTWETIIRRLLTDGAADTTFGVNGVVRHPINLGSSLAVQADGKVLVTGFLPASGGAAVVRLHASGAVDTAFGTAGTAQVSLEVMGVAVQGDGKIILAGKNGSSQQVSRLNTNGMLDSTFGTGGHAPSPFGSPSIATKPMIAADGHVLVLGRHETTTSPTVIHHHVVCYEADGSLRQSYGLNGVALTSLQAASLETTVPVSHASLLADGKLLVGAQAWNGIFSSFAMVRLLADGTRDDAYGGGVLRLISNGGASYPHRSSLGAIALRPDGGILYPSVISSSAWNSDLTEVQAFLPNGQADTAFANAGVLSMAGPNDGQHHGSAIMLRADGRFLLGGHETISKKWSHSQRLPDGTSDPAFNGGLLSLTDIGSIRDPTMVDMKLDAQGRTVSAGYLSEGASNINLVLTRHHPNGTLDDSFGQGGLVKTDLSGRDRALCFEFEADGRILVGGDTRSNSNSLMPFLAAYLPSGSLDMTFGTGGILINEDWQGHSIVDLLVMPEGRILVIFGGLSSRSMAQLSPDGSLDSSFGTNGIVTSSDEDSSISFNSAAIQKDGRIILIGGARLSYNMSYIPVICRYEPDGSLDTTFGSQGRRFVNVGGASSGGQSVTVQPDNRILVIASALYRPDHNDPYDIAYFQNLIRLEGGPLLANLTLEAPSTRSETGVRLRGTVNPNGFATTAFFEYGPTASYGQSIPLTLADDDGTVTESVETLLSGLSGGTSFHYRLTATTAAGTRSTPDSTFSTFSSLETWRQTNFGSAGNSGNAADTADFDLDGMPNLIEWACGLSPSLPSRLDTPVNVNASVIEFTYTRDTTAIGAVYQVEWSDTLPGTSWSTVGVTETVLSLSGTIQTVKATLPAGSNGGRFVRLKVQGPL